MKAWPLLLAVLPTPAVLADQHPGPIEEVFVVAHPLSAEGLAQAATILEGDELAKNRDANIGETLARQPGIRNSSFGQAAGRPVIHGLSGPRVRMMEDRLDTMDVSTTSVDHATTVDPLVADRVEVLKGPSTLLYGSGAIGGVVDVHTGRIPHEQIDTPQGGLELRLNDSSNLVSGAGELNGGVGSFAFHVDGFYREANDYDIPGFAESGALRALEEAEGEAEEEGEVRGTLPGSELETWGAAIGASYVGERGFIGASVSRFESDYGLPGGHGHEEEPEDDEEGNPVIDLEQTRFDLEAALADPFAGVASLNLRVGYNDYRHVEIEPGGEIATRFENQAWDTRLELTHDPVLDFVGTLGVQYSNRSFSAEGEESFVPPVDTRSVGVFWVGEREFRGFDLETGVRIERLEHDPEGPGDEDFTPWAVSLGAVVPLSESWQLGLESSYASRAPVAEELYSNGPHLATQSFELGDPSLDEEQALSFSGTLKHAGERWRMTGTIYYVSFSDYIYQQATGEEEDGLPVQQYAQDDADYFGVDLEAGVRLAGVEQGALWLNGMFDYVDAELDIDGNDHVPRLPPWRIGVGLELSWNVLVASVDYVHVDSQNDVSDFELPTDSYNDLRAYAGWNLPLDGADIELFVQGKNLTDDTQRYHSSFIKDFAPQPGRTIEGGVRITF